MIKATLKGLNVVVSGLDQYGVDVQEASYYAVVEAMKKAFQVCQKMITADDHTLRELALMGHPYGFRHPQQIHEPDSIIHKQSGAYAAALKAIAPSAVHGTVFSGQIVNTSPLDRALQLGTPKMRARPWMKWIVDNYGADFAALIEARIKAAIERRAS